MHTRGMTRVAARQLGAHRQWVSPGQYDHEAMRRKFAPHLRDDRSFYIREGLPLMRRVCDSDVQEW